MALDCSFAEHKRFGDVAVCLAMCNQGGHFSLSAVSPPNLR